jgi:hypothetical protein
LNEDDKHKIKAAIERPAHTAEIKEYKRSKIDVDRNPAGAADPAAQGA